jgi:hypothetical protein
MQMADFVATLTLPAEQTKWPAEDVPYLTACALHPAPPDEFVRLSRIDVKNGSKVESGLTPDDRATLERFWSNAGLAPIEGEGVEMTDAEWVPYVQVIDPCFGRCCATEVIHAEELRRAIQHGDIEAHRNGSLVRAQGAEPLASVF